MTCAASGGMRICQARVMRELRSNAAIAVDERLVGFAFLQPAGARALGIVVRQQRTVALARKIAGEIRGYRRFTRTTLRIQDENALHVRRAYAAPVTIASRRLRLGCDPTHGWLQAHALDFAHGMDAASRRRNRRCRRRVAHCSLWARRDDIGRCRGRLGSAATCGGVRRRFCAASAERSASRRFALWMRAIRHSMKPSPRGFAVLA